MIDFDFVLKTPERYNLYYISCREQDIESLISELSSSGLNSVNIGKELSTFINNLEDFSYLSIDVFDYCINLLNINKTQFKKTTKDVVIIYNLGILLEPMLKLNAEQLFKEFSKSTTVIILWQYSIDVSGRLAWTTQKDNYNLDFTELPLKKIQYAI